MNDGRIETAGYEAGFFEELALAEDRHFWFRHRNAIIAEVMTSVAGTLSAGYRVLEVGSGTGNTLRVLERVCASGTVVGTDPFEEGLRIARRRVTCEVVQSDIQTLTVPGRFDIIAAFDVLEHVEDDRQALEQLRTRLCDGGRVVLTVPAHMGLWSYADVAAHHYRRYSTGQLRGTLQDAGFVVEYLTPFMSVLYPLMWASRRLAAWRAGELTGEKAFALTLRDLRIVPGWNEWLLWLLRPEVSRVRDRRAIPAGTSLLAVARWK